MVDQLKLSFCLGYFKQQKFRKKMSLACFKSALSRLRVSELLLCQDWANSDLRQTHVETAIAHAKIKFKKIAAHVFFNYY